MLHQSKCGMRPMHHNMPVTMHIKALSHNMEPEHHQGLEGHLESLLEEFNTFENSKHVNSNKKTNKKKAPKKKGSKKKGPKKKGSKKKAPKKNKKGQNGGAVRAGSVQNFVQK